MARSKRAIGNALMSLIQERPYREISVQDVLDRAQVGRATFYAHYRNKEDVLYSSYEHLFEALGPIVARRGAPHRLFPIAELVSHVRESERLLAALEASGLSEDVWTLCEQYAARLIERRMPAQAGPRVIPRRVVARLLAGNAVDLMAWALSRDDVSPERVDDAFHELAGRILRPATVP